MKHLPLKLLQSTMLVLGCVAFGWVVFQYTSSTAQQVSVSASPSRLMTVEFTSLQTRDLQEQVELAGTILPTADMTVSASVNGRVTSVPLDLGDAVNQQQVIVEFDDAQSQVDLAVSAALVESAKVQLRISQSQLEFPEMTLEYIRRMNKKGFATSANLDQSETSLAIAKADVELSELRLQEMKTKMEQSQLVVDNTRITSPLAGLIAHRYANPGDFVRGGDPLLRIVDISTVIAAVHIVERDYARVALGQEAEIHVDALPAESFVGEVARIAPVLDVQTRTAVVHLRVDNSKSRLKPGMHARVSVVVSRRRNARLLPISALLERDGQPAVFVLVGEPPIAERRTISVGLADDESVEVLSGVSPEDRIVTLGSHVLSDGQQVEVASGDTMNKVFAAKE